MFVFTKNIGMSLHGFEKPYRFFLVSLIDPYKFIDPLSSVLNPQGVDIDHLADP
jgi:hypothetical protein